ncbi:transmembrane protein 176B isoform X2 [Chelonia mydas]|uniref:transmembrane protein 176B isoform X2 n=2 Tax=Chelonia mydas TaxID=8469 RepID=UPI001CA83A70|nr:transmembrane protein 176B isoform X2 [Chelonia mydas]
MLRAARSEAGRSAALRTQLTGAAGAECGAVVGLSASGVRMPTSVVKVNDMEVSTEGSDKTVINITVNQESWLAFLVRSMLQRRAKPWAPTSQGLAKGCYRGEQKVLGACQVLLGIVCGAIGVMLCFAPRTEEISSGSPFWTGALLIISGVFCIVSEKRGTGCWVWLALLLTLASVVSATVAVIIGARDMTWSFTFTEGSYLCGPASPSPTASEDFWRPQHCRFEFRRLENLFRGVRLLLLLTMATGLCITLYSFLYGCWALCCRKQDWAEATGSKEPLLSSDSILPPDKEKAQVVQDI